MFMEEYSVMILPSAQFDILDIMDHLNSLLPEEAVSYYDMLVGQLGTLSKTPEIYPLAKDTQLRLRGYRTLPANDYIAFFVIRDRSVELRRILYSRRQYDWLL